MYIATTQLHTNSPKRKAQPKVSASLPQSSSASVRATHGLSLPKLPSSVPSTLTVQENPLESSLTLLSFIDAGLVSESDVPDKWESNNTIIGSSLDRFLSKHSDKLTLFDMKIICFDSLDEMIDSEDIDRDELLKYCDTDPATDTINFAVYSNSWDDVFIGKKVEHLEKIIPGFGRTIMAYLTRATYSTMYCVTPTELHCMCSNIYWMGDEDESTILDEMRSEMDEEEFEAEKENIFKKSDLFACMPEWTSNYGDPFPVKKLQKLTGHKNALVAQVATALLPIAEVRGKDEYPHTIKGLDNNCSPSLFIRWNVKDETHRVHDDYYNYICESEGASEIHRFFISDNNPEQLKTLFSSMEKYINDTAALDSLLRLLMEEV